MAEHRLTNAEAFPQAVALWRKAIQKDQQIAEQPPQTRPCPVCDHLGYSDVLDQGPPCVVACTRCGMVFNDVATDVDYSGAKYAGGFEEWNEKRYGEAAFRIKWNALSSLESTVLDVGCSTGGLMKALRNFGIRNVYGIDPSPECATKAMAFLGTLADVGLVPAFPIRKWDCVILSHVLEHIRDTAAAMQKLVEVADSVYVEVPDGLRYCEHVKSPYQNWNAEHVNHFDLGHLNMLFHTHGFQIRTCGEYSCEPDNFPAIWAWFTRRASLRGRQEGYGRTSSNAMRRIEEQVKAIKGPVIAWGIGALARRLELTLLGKICRALDTNVDFDPTNRYAGQIVQEPDHMDWSYWIQPILVTTILHKDAVLADIKRLGLRNTVITLGD